jgi:PTS system mannose-specific IIA component
MIGVVLAAHGDVAPALLKAAEAIVGHLDAVEAITLQSSAGPQEMRAQVLDAVQHVSDGSGVLILCDMFGGTPSNVCLSCEAKTPVEVVTGVNLPMVVKLATARAANLPVEEAAAQIASYGQRHVTHATELMRARRRQRDETPEAVSRSAATPAGIAAAPVR